jgi:hypothetical protein
MLPPASPARAYTTKGVITALAVSRASGPLAAMRLRYTAIPGRTRTPRRVVISAWVRREVAIPKRMETPLSRPSKQAREAFPQWR